MREEKEEFLLKILEERTNNLFVYSANVLMTEPKQQYKKEFEETRKEIIIIKEIIKDYIKKEV